MITLSSDLHDIVNRALREDQVRGDITTRILFPKTAKAKAVIQAKQEGIVAGLPVAKTVFKQVDPKLRFKPIVWDGDRVKPGMIVAYLHGDGRSILRGERVALNFIQHLSGIATLSQNPGYTENYPWTPLPREVRYPNGRRPESPNEFERRRAD
jgi:nicotinate-nucleotide pyrophosphorylase (carboxylating)